MGEVVSESTGFKRWKHDYKVGDLVLWRFYSWCKACRVRNTGPNYVTIESLENPKDYIRVYELEISENLGRL